MSVVISGTNKLSRWVTIAIILAVTLLSSCLALSLIVKDTFQQRVYEVSHSLPEDSFIVDLRYGGITTILPYIDKLSRLVAGISELAVAKITVYIPTSSFTKDGQKHVAMEGLSFKAIDPEFFSIRGFALAQGRFFDAADSPSVAVIGASLAQSGNYKVGSVIRRPYMDKQYNVIGILQPNDGISDLAFSTHETLKEKYGVNNVMFIPLDSIPELLAPEFDSSYFESVMQHLENDIQLWVGVDPKESMVTVIENTQTYLENLPGIHVIHLTPTPPTKATYEYVSERTSGSLEQMGFIVITVGALSISGLMLMHVLLGAKVIGIKRALGATKRQLVWENLWQYSLLSFLGFILSLILIQPLLPLIGNFLGAKLQILPQTILFAMLGVTLLAPLCGLIPTREASKVSPLDAIRDRLDWGMGKRRFDLRQVIVSLAFAAAVGTMFMVSQIGLSTLAGIDASLRAVGRDMLLVEEPPVGSVIPIPKLTEEDDAKLCVTCLEPYGETVWMAQARLPIGASSDSLSRTNVLAVKRDVLDVRNYRLAGGNWLSNEQEAVIGSDLAYTLFRDQSPLGETILLGNNLSPFTIVGVLEPRAKHLADFDFDRNNAVFINWSDHNLAAATAQFEPRIFFRAKTPSAVIPAQAVIKRLLTESNPNAELLVVRNPMGDLEESKRLTETFNLASSVMALVTVVTACASVAALTLIQAREMQKTLALRRACGATKREVLTIILREVLSLIVIGAVIGLVAAQLGALAWARINDLPSVSDWMTVLIGLAISFVIAMLSAVWPAWYVARQAPAQLLD